MAKPITTTTETPVYFTTTSTTNKTEVQEISSNNGFISSEWITDKISGHSSGIVETETGFCVVFNGRNKDIEEKTKKGVWFTAFDKVTQKWMTPIEIVKPDQSLSNCSSPIICTLPPCQHAPSGELLVFFRAGRSHLTDEMQSYILRRPLDKTLEWSKGWDLKELPKNIIGPTKTQPTVTPEGFIFCGSSTQTGPEKETAIHVEISKDRGLTWSRSPSLKVEQKYGPRGGLEPALIWNKNELRLIARNRSNQEEIKGFALTAVSKDGGITWPAHLSVCKTLRNKDSGLDIVNLGQALIKGLEIPSGITVCFFNAHSRKELNMAVSRDGGETWSDPLIIDNKSGEFPAAILSKDGKIHVTYASDFKAGDKTQMIKHVVIDPLSIRMNNLYLFQTVPTGNEL